MRIESRTAVALALLLGVTLIGCETESAEPGVAGGEDTAAAAPAAAQQGAPMDTAGARAALDAMAQQWQDAANADSAAAVAALYTDDARYYSSTGNAEGREAIEALLGQGFPQARDLQIDRDELVLSRDIAYGTGTYSQTLTAEGGEQTQEGHYLVVARRQADGSWKIARHMSVEAMPVDTVGGGA